ncbi:MAG: creatininase family protein [Candidatus Pristimantibacillus lignocellulolyticus]|uniref:Creatininase family protein n=1 Tax=Candidatus Pristimantibacillus lignocellulolyticus TaxID=2994561 RepID=A0A9J6ZI29_9BACL|nr:MAG: creatininase family protein [Candidatus Pristimantibacillus lignocellulolyticus]
MRTRFLSKMTNGEVEQYLDRNDIIYIPVGVTETHGALPLDAETVLAEAIALKMAEASDGLVLHNLPYFFAGGTIIGRGTIQMSIKDGMAYLDKIAKSLLNQGFRRQVYVTSHGPAHMTLSGMVRDFFDETKVPILYIDMLKAAEAANCNLMESFHDISIGAYKVLGRLEDVPLNVPESHSVTYDVGHMIAGMDKNPGNALGKFAYQSAAVGSYFNEPSDHMVTPLLKTADEREVYADVGIKVIDELIEALDMPTIVATLRQADVYTKDVILPRYGTHLPR